MAESIESRLEHHIAYFRNRTTLLEREKDLLDVLLAARKEISNLNFSLMFGSPGPGVPVG